MPTVGPADLRMSIHEGSLSHEWKVGREVTDRRDVAPSVEQQAWPFSTEKRFARWTSIVTIRVLWCQKYRLVAGYNGHVGRW
jgi:hypothetical protein